MNVAIRRVGLAVVFLFVALAGQLTYLQLVRAHSLNRDPNNVRVATRDLTRDRGDIVTADGAVLARSELIPAKLKDPLKYQRKYPLGSLFGHITGYQSVNLGNTGVEREYDSELLGRDVRLQTRSLSDLLNTHNPTGTVVLSLTKSAQQVAKDALHGRRGSVVVLDVQTGGIVAMYSEPSFDPNPLASHKTDAVQKYFEALESLPIHPDLPRAYRERYPAGSTFKVLTTAVALDAGIVNPTTPFPQLTQIELPQSNKPLGNFGGERCGGTLAQSFTVSCNTTFARIGLTLGDRLAQGITAFGINTPAPPIDLSPGAASSVGPLNGTFENNKPFFALGAIGQGDVAVTPLEMALVAEAVADDGVIMVPHVMTEIRATDGTVVRRYQPKVWRRAMTPGTALILNEFMRSVVADPNGTGSAARIPGITVAGKTGTAQAPGGNPHAWFIAFAPAEAPRYAIAVIVERGGDEGSEATGGRVAAPVAAQVLTELLKGTPSG